MSSTLAELARVLDEIAALAGDGRQRFDTDARQRWAIERLWMYDTGGHGTVTHRLVA